MLHDTKTGFTPAIQRQLNEITRELSEGPRSVVERICDTILQDIDGFCALIKKNGDAARLGGHATCSWRTQGDFAGTYVGYGLGHGWIDLGFLTDTVADTLRKRIESMAEEYVADQPSEVDTMTGTVFISGGVYRTKRGDYEIERTYATFIKKRVA